MMTKDQTDGIARQGSILALTAAARGGMARNVASIASSEFSVSSTASFHLDNNVEPAMFPHEKIKSRSRNL